MDRIKTIIQSSPFIITLIYIILGGIWVQFSDSILSLLVNRSGIQIDIQTVQKWIFVGLSGCLIYFLVRKNNSLLDDIFIKLEISRDKYAATFEQAPVGIIHHTPDGKWLEVNQSFCNILGYDKEEFLKMNFEDFIHPDDLDSGLNLDQELMNGERSSYQMQKRYKKKSGEYMDGMVTKSAVTNVKDSSVYFVKIVQDISKRVEAENLKKKSLKDKEILLSEIHHRVKNNLALMSGLIDLENFFSDNRIVHSVLEKCKLRIKCLSLVYETFSQSYRISAINFSHYLTKLMDLTKLAYNKQDYQINFNEDNPPVFININQAIPLGLICNEILLLINHGLNEPAKDQVINLFLFENSGSIILKINDNISTHDWENKFSETRKPGIEIVDTLVTQIGGSMTINSNDAGNSFELTFRKSEQKGVGSFIDNKSLYS